MADSWLVTRLKKIGNAVVEKAGAALVIYVVLNIGGVSGLIAVALKGDSHGPWFYAIAGALACSSLAVLLMAILVIIQLTRKKGTVSVEEIGESQFAEMQFAYERAKEQGRQMYRVVDVTRVDIESTGIVRKLNPYFDVAVSFWNYSMFDVELEDLTGWLSLNTWEFRESSHWIKSESRTVWANNAAMYVFRQNLTQEDVEYIRANKAHFGLSNLELFVKGNGASASFVERQELPHWGGGTPPTNEVLFTALGGKWNETA